MKTNNKKYNRVNSLSECADKIKDLGIPQANKSSFWNKPQSKVLSFEAYSKTDLGEVFEGSSPDTKGEEVISTAPLGVNTSLLWSNSCKDKVFIMRIITAKRLKGDGEEVGSSPMGSIDIPKGVLSGGVLPHKTLQIFAFNFVEILRSDISNANLDALDFVREWTNNSEQGEQFIKMSLNFSKKEVVKEVFKDFTDLIKDEDRFKKMFPTLPTFSEWKTDQGLDSALNDKLKEMGVDPKDMGEA